MSSRCISSVVRRVLACTRQTLGPIGPKTPAADVSGVSSLHISHRLVAHRGSAVLQRWFCRQHRTTKCVSFYSPCPQRAASQRLRLRVPRALVYAFLSRLLDSRSVAQLRRAIASRRLSSLPQRKRFLNSL